MAANADQCGVELVDAEADHKPTVVRNSEFIFLDEMLVTFACSADAFARWRKAGLVPPALEDFPGRRLAWRRQAVIDWIRNLK